MIIRDGTVYKRPKELDEHDWEALEEGETIRVHCSHWKCEDKNDAFTITRTFDGCVYNCYRCGTSGVLRRSSNPHSALARIRALRGVRHKQIVEGNMNISLPGDFIPLITGSKLIPPQAYAWLYQYEIDEDDFFDFNIGYSPKLERLIFPFYKDDKLIAWQGRNVQTFNKNTNMYKSNKDILKWYTEYKDKTNTLYFKISKSEISLNKNKISSHWDNLILVEDLVSAIKVWRHYLCDTVAILNSTLRHKHIIDLNMRNYNHVYLWLDPDAYIKALQASHRFRSEGLSCSVVKSSTDPKEVPYNDMPIVL